LNSIELRRALKRGFTAPTVRQREAYARFAHTLAAASVIGVVTIAFAQDSMTMAVLWRVIGLATTGVACFSVGILLLDDPEWT
jgi:hypothetical protein